MARCDKNWNCFDLCDYLVESVTWPVRCSQATTHCSQMVMPVLRFSFTDRNDSVKIFRPLSFLCTYLPSSPPGICTHRKRKKQKSNQNIKYSTLSLKQLEYIFAAESSYQWHPWVGPCVFPGMAQNRFASRHHPVCLCFAPPGPQHPTWTNCQDPHTPGRRINVNVKKRWKTVNMGKNRIFQAAGLNNVKSYLLYCFELLYKIRSPLSQTVLLCRLSDISPELELVNGS